MLRYYLLFMGDYSSARLLFYPTRSAKLIQYPVADPLNTWGRGGEASLTCIIILDYLMFKYK